MGSPTKKGHSRSWSFRSKKEDVKLSQSEKRRSKMTRGVDPTRAITEDEPFQVNQSKNSARSLSTLKFKDRFGNDIVEPDLTNPTRHRWERPLETIRGFEAAIYKDEHRGSYVERGMSNAGRSSETVNTIESSWRPHQQQQSGQYETAAGHYSRNRHQGDALGYANRSARSITPRSGPNNYDESELGYGNMNGRSPGPNGHGYPRQRPRRRPVYDPNYDAESPNSGGPSQPYGYNYPSNGGGESPITNPGSSSSGAGSDGPSGFGNIREPPLPKSNSGQSSFGFRDQAMFESSQQITPFEPFNSLGQAQMNQNAPTSPTNIARKPISPNTSTDAKPAGSPTDAKLEKDKKKSWFKRRSSKN